MTENYTRMTKLLAVQAVVENISLWVTSIFGAFVVLAVFIMLGVVFMEPFGMWGLVASVAYICYFFAMGHKNHQLAKTMSQGEYG